MKIIYDSLLTHYDTNYIDKVDETYIIYDNPNNIYFTADNLNTLKTEGYDIIDLVE